MKSVFAYLLLLALIDTVCAIAIGLLEHVPGAVIVGSLFIRIFFILIVLSPVFFVNVKMLPGKPFVSLVITNIIGYLLIPVTISFLKPRENSIKYIIFSTHESFYLFSIIYLPFIVASLAVLIIMGFDKKVINII